MIELKEIGDDQMKEDDLLNELYELREKNHNLQESLRCSIIEKENTEKRIKQQQEINYSLSFFIGIIIVRLYFNCFTDFNIYIGLEFWEIVGKLFAELIISTILSAGCLVVVTLIKLFIETFKPTKESTISKKIATVLIITTLAFFIAVCIIAFKVL